MSMTELPDDGFMVAWNIEPVPCIEVGPWPDRTRWSDRYRSTSGCCNMPFLNSPPAERAQVLLNLAAGLMFDGIPPEDVLREFAKVSLWRDMSVMLPGGRYERAFIAGRDDWNPHNPG